MCKLGLMILIVATVCTMGGGCMQSANPNEGVVATDVVVPSSGATFSIDPPKSRNQTRFDIRIKLTGDWAIAPPWDKIRLGGEEIRVTAELRTVDGEVYTSSRLGQSVGAGGTYLVFTFHDDLPRGVEFDQVEITPSSSLECQQIIWRDWTPK
jgi:hypothetical protein